jgi:hypothetical protein
MKKFLCFTLLSFFTLAAEAKVFRNSYLSFELPDNWNCGLENTEWVCRSSAEKDSREAIIILTAKEVGPTDSFEAYTTHLNTPQQTSVKKGGMSKVVYPPKRVLINEQQWLDGLHMASEVPNYFTRYLATMKDKIAVLFTCSAHKDFYTKYSQDFFRAVQSLRVIATKDLLAKPENGIRPGGETLGATIGGAMPGDLVAGAEESETSGANGGGMMKLIYLALAVTLAGAAGYIFIRSKKQIP